MRLLLPIFLFIWWGDLKPSRADDFAAVPGTGWTDISQLSSTCSLPGYFVNPSDCSRFYVCVDHSTPEHNLLLRYDFDCPGGLAFDESTKNCNYPGPSGCVSSSSGWGWSKPESGIWQSTATVSKVPNASWGTPTRNPVSTTIIRVPGSTGQRTIIRGPSTPSPLPSNPRINLPSTTIVQVPVTAWESLRIRPHNSRVFQSTRVTEASSGEASNGWSSSSSTKLVNSGVFESAKVTQQHGSSGATVAWGSSKIIPVDSSSGVFQSARVTPVPHTEWESPQPFPVAPQPVQPIRVVQSPSGGWSELVRISPTPGPQPANPAIQNYVYNTASPTPRPVAWQSVRLSPTPVPHAPSVTVQGTTADISQVQRQQVWQSARVSQVPQSQSPVNWESTRISQAPQAPAVSWQSTRISQAPQAPSVTWQSARVTQQVQQQQQPNPVAWNGPQAANPGLNYVQSNPFAANPEINYVQSNTFAANPSINFGPAGPAAANPAQNFFQAGQTIQVGQAGQRQTLQVGQAGQAAQTNQNGNAEQTNSVVENQSQFNVIRQQTQPADPTVTVPQGWENVRITQLPSGYIWQSSPNAGKSTQTETFVESSSPETPTGQSPPPAPHSLQAGNYGIVQQVINEQEQGQQAAVNGKSHIQLVYETKENQFLNPQSQSIASQNANQQSDAVQQISSRNPGNSIYEFVAPPSSGLKGRIIVLYAPLNTKGGKREAPVIEVEVEDDEDDNKNEESENN